MAANNTNTTTQSSAATTISTIKPGVTTVSGGSSNMQGGSQTGSGWGLASGYSATTNGARSTFFPTISGNVLHLFTLSVFFIMALLMN
ncbi:hypothetical protein C0J45_10197 [Silurus meridionalis]|nr:hypothetical protein C0J45_10197 [Silurus meridionalis]